MSQLPRLLLISSVPPLEAGGGESVLYYHLRGLTSFEWRVVTDRSTGVSGFVTVQPPAWLRRLQHTRFASYAHAWAQFHPGHVLTRTTWQLCRAYQPQVILTVAHGNLWPVARNMAARLNRPLVTMFMDWWPDLAPVPRWFRSSIEHAFRACYRQSRVAISVSPGMIEELGPHPDARLQYGAPLPRPILANQSRSPKTKFRLVYLGNMRDVYAGMTQAIFEALDSHPGIEVHLAGADPDWPPPVRQHALAGGAYKGFLTSETLHQELEEADALLVVMTWAPEAARRMRTSFPSKIPNYCQYGKPIIVWAPGSSSAAAWARQTGAALLIDRPEVGEVVQALELLAANSELRRNLASRAAECARTLFSPEQLRAEFEEALRAATEHAGIAGQKDKDKPMQEPA